MDCLTAVWVCCSLIASIIAQSPSCNQAVWFKKVWLGCNKSEAWIIDINGMIGQKKQ